MASTAPASAQAPVPAATERQAGLAHVASLAFLATRVAPPLGFPLSLAGGVALARSGARTPLRTGYGVAIAAVIETIAIAGPSRLGGPLTQAATAPLLGRMGARGRAAWQRVFACAGIRFAYTAITTAFFILVISGGIGAYTRAYDRLVGSLPLLPSGAGAGVAFTALALAGWALVAASVQTFTFERALRGWPAAAPGPGARAAAGPAAAGAKRFDPRAVAIAVVIGFVILLLPVSAALLAGSALWLALAWVASNADRAPLRTAAVLAALLAGLAFVIAEISGQGAVRALELGARAALLALYAGWLRAATGDLGFREVARRTLRRLRPIPAAAEAGVVLGELGARAGIGAAAQQLAAAARGGQRTPRGAVAAILSWIAIEAARFRPLAAAEPMQLRAGPLDLVLVLSATLPLALPLL